MKRYMSIIYLGVFIVGIFVVLGCSNSNSHDSKKNKKKEISSTLLELQEKKETETPELKNYYIVPSPLYDMLLNPRPKVAYDLTDTNKNFNDIISKDITSKDKIIEYLDQKRQYAKTNIFSKIP